MRLLAGLATLFALLAGQTPGALAQPGWANNEPIVDASLVSDRAVVAPGESFHIGLRQVMPEGWHTYWRNPGDNGLPTEVRWDVPAGVSIGEIEWPAPEEMPLAETIMDYGYHGEVVLPFPVELDAGFAAGELVVTGHASWLVCEIICVPEERTLSLTLPVAAQSQRDADGYWYIQAALDAVPQPVEGLEARIGFGADAIVLELEGGDFAAAEPDWQDLTFFPHDGALIQHAAGQRSEREAGLARLILAPGFNPQPQSGTLRGGVLRYTLGSGGGAREVSVEIQARPDPAMALAATAAGAGTGTVPAPSVPPVAPGLIGLLLLAFGGGLILNLMPCVFPILSIKVLQFVEGAHDHPHRTRRHALFFLAGVILSFVALAAVLVGLREFGLPVGWGFQLQVPVVVAALTLLLFAIGLNLLGVFEIGTSLQGVGSGLSQQPGARGAFFTGVLAVIVAAPCVGPLAAGALGLALTQPAIIVLLVSAAMGAGLAAPFVLVSFVPALQAFMPKPGRWMEQFKQFLAFPMFASVIWLSWVLVIQSGSTGLLLLGIALLALSLAIWARKQKHLAWTVVAIIALLTGLAATLAIARLPAATNAPTLSGGEEAWSRERVAELRAEGRPVFIDVTAAWCVTCQVNKLGALSDPAVRDAFEQYGVVEMRADWTNRNDEIAALIAEHGQAGVPLYLVFPADGGPARVLPSVLTRDIVVTALAEAAG
ncbi:protein-disulfide reductase DsbD family protein [Maricaulis sp.]|uniref:protein-disulfide reductase DsbD family protein n=1 Tax=Maricaulis sp. TaxID=1486257 RepID=UPI003A901144